MQFARFLSTRFSLNQSNDVQPTCEHCFKYELYEIIKMWENDKWFKKSGFTMNHGMEVVRARQRYMQWSVFLICTILSSIVKPERWLKFVPLLVTLATIFKSFVQVLKLFYDISHFDDKILLKGVYKVSVCKVTQKVVIDLIKFSTSSSKKIESLHAQWPF